MLLTDEQHKQVVYLITEYLGEGRYGQAARDLFGPEALRAVPGGLNAHYHAKWLLDWALGLPAPDTLITVVSQVDAAGTLVKVHQLVHALRTGQLDWSGPGVGELWMPAEWPFADREPLRTKLCEIAKGNGPTASTIDGPAGHGKRTMCAYIEHCARRHAAFTPVVEHLQRLHDNRMVDYLADQLRLKLGVVVPQAIEPEPERRAVTLASNLGNYAVHSRTPVWFVANLVEPEQDAGVLKFLGQLLLQVQTNPLLAKKLRITVLADFAAVAMENLPETDSRYTLAEISETEIAGWLAAAVPGKDEAYYRHTAGQVISHVAALQPTPRMRLRLLAQKCVDAHGVLLQEA
ncbi:hypothetical protein [Actinokineospora sp.]|uniref:hypothetical protein n=1 Tax=Actinokineospora sp. TaxID=1872133 RepID=UPI003D6B894D